MNKIGLVTFYDDNYGTCLQAFALQYAIELLGYKVAIVKYNRSVKSVSKENNFMKCFRYPFGTVVKYLLNYKCIQLKKRGFTDFRRNYLHFDESEQFYRDSDLSGLKGRYAAVVCGSDMMWSSSFKEDWPFYLLSFEDKNKTISYSPSFGKNDLTEEEVHILKPLIENIGFLSCREEAGVELINGLFDLKARHTIDPTCLLKSETWSEIISNNKRLVDQDYVLTYCFLGTVRYGRDKIFKQFKNEKKGKLVIITGAEKEYNKFRYDGYVGPLEFVHLYRDSKFVITDTFHGMLFAIIFQKPFVVLDKSPFGVTADRLISTLKTLGLEDRYIGYDTIIDERFMSLDYTKVNEILGKQRMESFDYLSKSIQNVVGF